MKFNVLPLRGKVPSIIWKVWQGKCQTKEDIEAMEWKNSSGLGVVMGINDLRCFDIDMVEDPAILNEILSDLNLSGDYSWVVQSGSGEGYHIYFRCSEAPLQSFSDKAVYKYRLKKEGICHHIELRVKECQTALPPSRHESGGVYSFVNNEPLEAPTVIADDKVIECIRKHCLIGKEYESKQENEKRLYYDKKRLEDAIKYLSIHLPAGSYDDWITIGFGLASLGRAGRNIF